MPQPRLSAADLVTFFLAGMAGIIAGNLTWLALFSGSDAVFNALQNPMMPGLLAAYTLAGDGSGYLTVQGFTPYLAVFLNAVVYALAIMIPRLLWCHIASQLRASRTEDPHDHRRSSAPGLRHRDLQYPPHA
jgi:hypothetical protein